MRVEKAPFGYMIWLMPEEQNSIEVIEKIKAIKENDRVAVFISGSENVQQVIHKAINKYRIKN